ncbi:MAG: 3-phosphoglycerate dehydrogenase [Phycisphaeraceae bacterium]|nr:3-phosphoglycerate dehydrogenase [Phycisphaeraceae bacterium]
MRPLVVIAEPIEDEPLAWLEARCETRAFPVGETVHAPDLARAKGLIVRTYTRVNADLLDRAPALSVVGRAGVGLDNIDLAECARRGIAVVHTPGANTRAVVEFTLGLMLDAVRPREYLRAAPTPEGWHERRRASMRQRQLSELSLGVLGLGRVGSGVARAAAGLGMRVLYHDLREIPGAERAGASPVGFEELLRASDILSIHVDDRLGNRHLLNAQALAMLRPGAVVINTSRGLVVDAEALGAFLRTNPVAMAMIDVHEPEPIEPDYPLLGLTNTRLTAHVAAGTRSAKIAMSWVVRDVWRVLSGEAPRSPAPAPAP